MTKYSAISRHDCAKCYRQDIETLFDGDIVQYMIVGYTWGFGPGCAQCGGRECPHYADHDLPCPLTPEENSATVEA